MPPFSRRTALAAFGATPLLLLATPSARADQRSSESELARAFATGSLVAPTLRVTPSSPYSNVVALQYLLSAWGVPTVADGDWGPQTTASVRRFQAKKKLTVDGTAGPRTMSALIAITGFAGSRNTNATRAAQRLLVKVGYHLSVDGDFGPVTAGAVKAFQKRIGLGQSGRVDATTWAFLFEPPAPPAGTWSSSFITQREDYRGFSASSPTQMQVANLRFIIAIGKGHHVPVRGIEVAIATAITESWLYNRYVITDGTSGGLYQQQTSTGWGSYAQVRNKLLATLAFFGIAHHTHNKGLAAYYPAYLHWSIGATAQKIQISAYPSRYQAWATTATNLYTKYAPGVAPYTG